MTQYETVCLFIPEKAFLLVFRWAVPPGALRAALVDTVRTHMYTAPSPRAEMMEPDCLGLPQLCQLLAVWLQTSYLTSLCLSFPDLRYGVAVVPTSQGCSKDNVSHWTQITKKDTKQKHEVSESVRYICITFVFWPEVCLLSQYPWHWCKHLAHTGIPKKLLWN